MLPLWIEYSYITRFSIGWRMGYGEDYLIKFSKWFDELNALEREQYIKKYPEPIEWTGWYKDTIPDEFYDIVLVWDKFKTLKYNNMYILNKYRDGLNCSQIVGFSKKIFSKDNLNKYLNKSVYISFDVDHNKYFSIEQYVLAEKARLFNDFDTMEKIVECTDLNNIRMLDKQIKGYKEKEWEKYKYNFLLQGNFYKYSQDSKLRKLLLDTKNKIIVYISSDDDMCDIGITVNKIEDISNPLLWKGQNLLGYALMEVRDEIRRVYGNYVTEKIEDDEILKKDKLLEEYYNNIKTILELPKEELDNELLGKLVVAYNNTYQHEKAIRVLELLQLRQKENSLWYYRYGYALYYLDRFEQAKENFLMALTLNPDEDIKKDCITLLDLIKEEQKDEVIFYDNDLGKFRLDRANYNYTTIIDWCGSKKELQLFANDEIELRTLIDKYKENFSNHLVWDKKVSNYIVDEIFDTKEIIFINKHNINRKDFNTQLHFLYLQLHLDNKYSIWFEHDSLYYGKGIVVKGNLNDGFESVKIEK